MHFSRQNSVSWPPEIFAWLQLQSAQSKDIHIFWHWVFICFVEVIFLIVDLVHAGLLCLPWCCVCLVLPDLFLCRANLFGEFFLNTAESSKRINQSGCTEPITTCMLSTYLSFSERAHTKKIRSWIKKFESWDNAEATALVSATQANVLQSKLRISCLRNVLELKFKTHDNRKC